MGSHVGCMAELSTLLGTRKLCQRSSVAEAHSTPEVWDVGCPLRLWAYPPPTRILRQDSLSELLCGDAFREPAERVHSPQSRIHHTAIGDRE